MELNFYKLMKPLKILNIKFFKLFFVLFLICVLDYKSIAMEKNLYHHLPDGTFRNPEGSPKRSDTVNFSYKTFIKEKKKLIYLFPKDM